MLPVVWPTWVSEVTARTTARQLVSESGNWTRTRATPSAPVVRAGAQKAVSGKSLRGLPPGAEEVRAHLERGLDVDPGFFDRMETMLAEGSTAPTHPTGLVWAAQKPLWTRLWMLLSRMFPPPATMAQIYHLPDGSPRAMLYYVRRPLDLLARHGSQIWELLRGVPETREAWGHQRELEAWLGVERAW